MKYHRSIWIPFLLIAISQSAQSEEVDRWLTVNFERVREFLAWSKSYQWAKR